MMCKHVWHLYADDAKHFCTNVFTNFIIPQMWYKYAWRHAYHVVTLFCSMACTLGELALSAVATHSCHKLLLHYIHLLCTLFVFVWIVLDMAKKLPAIPAK